MKIKFEYNGKSEYEFEKRIIPAYQLFIRCYDQKRKEKLLKNESLTLEQFKKKLIENKISSLVIKNSSISQDKSICYFLIEKKMLNHLEHLVSQFGREILDFGSIHMPSNSGPAVYHSLWDASLKHINEDSFLQIVNRLMDINGNINLHSFHEGSQHTYTFLDKLLALIEDKNESDQNRRLINIAKLCIHRGAKYSQNANINIKNLYRDLINTE